MNTVKDALRAAVARFDRAGVDNPALTARLLLSKVLGRPREWLTAHDDALLDAQPAADFSCLADRVITHEPLAYILGHREFYGLDFAVDPRVLVPRPETEMLVELALIELGRPSPSPSPPTPPLPVRERRVELIDVGTGCGAVAVAVAWHAPGARVIASDVSPDALDVARANAERHGVAERIKFTHSDLLSAIDVRARVIAANLPYVSREEIEGLPPEIQAHEPRVALDGGADGLDLVRRLLSQLAGRVSPGGAVFLEIGASQGPAALAAARETLPDARIELKRDLAGLDRVVCIWI